MRMRLSSLVLPWAALALLGACTQAPGAADGPAAEDAAGSADGPAADLSAPDLSASPGADLLSPPPDLRDPPDLRVVDAGGRTTLRIVASNLTSGNAQSYDPGHGLRILQGLKPDIALMQEFNYGNNSAAAIRAMVDANFGATFAYYRQPSGSIPNGVISRFPILASGVWDDPNTSDRELVWARIDVPGPKDLWAVSVHLLTASSSVRNTQANTLVGLVKMNVPAGDYLVIGGDFNTDTAGEPCLTTLGQVVVTDLAMAPQPVDGSGKAGTNASRAKPYDWVLADPDLNPLRVPVRIGAQSFPSGLVFDSRVYTPLADVMPVQQGDSGAANMQHMAVVKDFTLPN